MQKPTHLPNGKGRRITELTEYQAALAAAVAAFPKDSTNDLVRAVERRLKRESAVVGQLITEQMGNSDLFLRTFQ